MEIKNFESREKYFKRIGKDINDYILNHSGRLIINHTGKKIGSLTAIKPSEIIGKKGYWLFECSCGNMKDLPVGSVFNVPENRRGIVTCGCGRGRAPKPKGSNHKSYKGYMELSGTTFNRYRQGARNRKIDFNITIEEIWNQFILQNKKCKFTGIVLTLTDSNRDSYGYNDTASLDRIDSSKGYNKDNVQWVHKKINIMKMSMSDEELINWCKIIAEHNI